MKTINYNWPSAAVFWGVALFLFTTAASGQMDADVEKEGAGQGTVLSISEGGSTKTRVVILTSGLAEFTSAWLEDSADLAVEFKTGRIESKIAEEITVNRGIIKKIRSRYVEKDGKRFLAALNFELVQRAPYEIFQRDGGIFIELQIPAGAEEFVATEESFGGTSADNPAIQERLAAMDTVLSQAAQEQPFSGETVSAAGIEEKTPIAEAIPAAFFADKEFSQRGRVKDVSPATLPGSSKGATLVLLGLNLALSIVLWAGWIKYQKLADKVRQIGLRLQEKEKSIAHENIVRKAVEDASLQREKEYQHLKEVLAKNEHTLLQKEKECQILKEALVQNTLPKIEAPAGVEGIAGRSKEKRSSIRLDLSRDYRKTVILRMKFSPRGKHLKCFATNIGLNGLCFETKENLPEKAPVRLRLFFYGETAPIMDIHAAIVWKKEMNALNYYGVMWTWPEKEEENRNCVKRYIESKLA